METGRYLRTNTQKFGLFVNEEVPSDCDYNFQPTKISEQIDHLLKLFPEIGNNKIINNNHYLPPETEGWFVIPRWQALASNYSEAVKKVINKINEIEGGSLINYLEKDLETKSFYQSTESIEALQKLEINQPNTNFLVVAAQFGYLHKGQSPCRVLELIKINNDNSKVKEFPLGLYAVGMMLLTHFDRLNNRDDLLWIDCLGDRITTENNSLLYPCIMRNGGRIIVNARANHASDDYGSATGFIF